jgi:hypothetical protein
MKITKNKIKFKHPSIFLVPYLNPCENRKSDDSPLNFGGIMAIENLPFTTFSF